jgi:carbamate kinase
MDRATSQLSGNSASYLEAIEQNLRKSISDSQGAVHDLCMHILAAGGKRIRPLLAWYSGLLFGPASAELMETATAVVRLIRAGYRVVLTHGNGPQVGAQLIRSESAAASAYRLPLDCCVASTQGEVGYVLQYAMWQMMQAEGLNTPVVSLITQVLVDPNDPAFQHPTKPIGPSYTREIAEHYRDLLGWVILETPSHGFRRVVPSPEPIAIVELDAIKACVDRGQVVIAGGGGGVPVFNDHDISKGVEAVIDKDHTSAILARQLEADVFAIATDVDSVFLDFKKPNQRPIRSLTLRQCRQHLKAGQFPPGSMGPKITAAVKYLELGGKTVVITDHAHLLEALEGKAGTRIIRGRQA